MKDRRRRKYRCTLTTGCMMYRFATRKVSDITADDQLNIRGVTTVTGERIMFSPIEMERRSLALVRNDTLYAHVNWRGWSLPLARIDSLHIRMPDRPNSAALTVVTVAAALYAAVLIYPETAFVGCDPKGRRPPPLQP